MKRWNKRLVMLAAAILLMTAGTLLNVAISTNGGNVKVRRVTYSDSYGNMVSGILYIPRTATRETPAPAVLTNHGGGASAEAQSSYNVELARRGYVVLSWDASNSGSSEASPDETHGGEASYAFLQSVDYVQKDQLITSGHSMGGVYSFMVAGNHPDHVKAEIAVGMNPGMNDTENFHTNYVCIIGKHDESNLVRSDGNILNTAHNELYHNFFGLSDDETLEVGTLYGSFEEGTARIFYMPNSSHAGAMVNRELLAQYLETVMTATTAPNPITASDQVWMFKDIGMIIQFSGLILLLFASASLLLCTKLFSALILPARRPVGFQKNSLMWWISILLLLFLPAVLFIPGTTLAQKFDVTSILKLDNTANGFALWSLVTACIVLLLFLLYHYLYGKKVGGNLMTYGLSTAENENRVHIAYILKALLFACCIVGITYAAYLLMYYITGGDIHIWLASIRPVTYIRMPYYPVYFFLQIPFFLFSTLAGRSISLNNGERTKGSGMRNSMILSLLFGVLGLGLLFLVFNIVFRTTGTVLFPKNRGYIYAGAIFSMIPAFAVSNTINCYITNKTNSIYAGLFSAVMWSTWIMTAANAIA